MKKISLSIILSIFLSSFVFAQSYTGIIDTTLAVRTNASSRKAISVTTEFMNALVSGGSAETLSSHCAVPFSYSDTTLILTKNDLKILFDSVVVRATQNVHKNHPHLENVYVYGAQTGVLRGIIPINVYLTVATIKFNINGQEPTMQIIATVQVGDTAKIVGLSN
jgi:hypothetical protein